MKLDLMQQLFGVASGSLLLYSHRVSIFYSKLVVLALWPMLKHAEESHIFDLHRMATIHLRLRIIAMTGYFGKDS